MRTEIKEFAERMEKIASKHDKEKGNSWKDSSYNYLEQKLIEEVLEYLIISNEPLEIVDSVITQLFRIGSAKKGNPQKELADIGNICWMLYQQEKNEGE